MTAAGEGFGFWRERDKILNPLAVEAFNELPKRRSVEYELSATKLVNALAALRGAKQSEANQR